MNIKRNCFTRHFYWRILCIYFTFMITGSDIEPIVASGVYITSYAVVASDGLWFVTVFAYFGGLSEAIILSLSEKISLNALMCACLVCLWMSLIFWANGIFRISEFPNLIFISNFYIWLPLLLRCAYIALIFLFTFVEILQTI